MVIGLQPLMLKQNKVITKNLDICISNNYICLKVSSKYPKESYFSDFNFEKRVKTEFLSNFLDKILDEKNLYNESIGDVTIHYDNELFCFVPNELFDENKRKEYLKYITELKNDDFISHDSINELDIKNIYLPYVNVNNLLIQKFKEISYFHYNTTLLKRLVFENNKLEDKTNLFCIVLYEKLKVVVFKKNNLSFFNCFDYQNSSDIVYFLLSTCQNLELDINNINLSMIINHNIENLIAESKEFFKKTKILFDSTETKQSFIFT